MTVRTRFAPSPTGFMHVGNLRTCLYAYFFAKKNNGTFVIRIEDTDQEREVAGAVDIIYSTLRKAGIVHDEGPDKDGGYAPYIQSQRKDIYIEYAKKLVDCGGAYYCFCDKERLDSLADENGIKRYDKHCMALTKAEIEERISRGDSYVIRQNVIQDGGASSYEDMVFGNITVPHAELEDGVLLKSDGMPTYNFANVVDDHLMNITHVIRGMEYLSSTPKYNLIYDAFGWARPQYMHLPPIMKDAQRKLSKRYGDANFEDFLAKGFLVPAIVNYISLLGWCPEGNREKLSMSELIEMFDVKGVSRSGAILDEAKMRWMNGEYIKEMPIQEFIEAAKPYINQSKIGTKYDLNKLAPMLITRIEVLSDIAGKVNFLEEFDGYDLSLYQNKKNKLDESIALECLFKLKPTLEAITEWTEPNLQEAVARVVEESGMKKAQVFLSLRVAVTGAAMTPGGGTEMADLLGRDETIRRLNESITRLQALVGGC